MRHYLGMLLRDTWFRILMWIIGTAGLTLVVPPAFGNMYSSDAEREALKTTLDNPAMVALVGPVPPGDYTTAVMFSHEMLVFMGIIHGLFGIMIANSISRKMEDQGLLEYVTSAGITRRGIFGSQMLIGIGMNLLLGAVIFGGLAVMNIDSFGVEGNLLYAMGTALFGLMFFVITIILAQLLPASEWSFGVSLSLLLLFYLYRASTDVLNTDYSVLSPYHWLSRLEVYSSNLFEWLWPFAIIVVLIAAAWVLFAKRDLDDSYLKFDLHRKTRSIHSYPRLQISGMKILVISWMIGMILIGFSYGSIFGDLDSFINDNELLGSAMENASGSDPLLQFVSTLILLTSVIGAIPALMIASRIMTEEKSSRLELLVSTRIPRAGMLTFHGIYAALIGMLGIFLAMLTMFTASIAAEDIDITFGDYMMAAVNYASPIVLFTGLSMLLIGISMKFHIFAWLYLLYSFLVNYLGVIVGIDEIWQQLTPFYFLAEIPVENMEWAPWFIIFGIGIVLGLIGIALFRRRDVA